MKTRHSSPIAATLLTTAFFGIGALPVFAANPLNSYAGDISLQNAGDHFTLTVNPYPDPPYENDGHFLVGLTTGILNDITTGGSSDPFYMFCVDFNHDINPTLTYNTIIESLVGPLTPDADPIGESLATLQTQALLGANFGITTPDGSHLQLDIESQHDIWNLDLPSPTGPGTPFAADTMNELSNAQAAQPTADYSGAFVFDIQPYDAQGNPYGPGQAFMPVASVPFNNHSSATIPEPGTLALLGLGLIGLGSLKLRRTRR